MKKFELGERVQFIRSSELKVGAIKRIYEESNEYQVIVDDSNLVLMIHKVHLAKLDQPEQQSEKVKKINEIMLELIHRKDMDILSDADITKMLIEALDIVNTL
ncbi:TPA: hypothetical protein U0J22_002922, partial [Listeria monocytogenes]|nr:hypothetical protein [Listeria monocytogenes]